MQSTFEDDIESGRRMLAQAAPDKKSNVLRQFAREVIRWQTVKGMPKADVVDARAQAACSAGAAAG